MEKLDLSKLKLASSSLGERIKTSGAQVGRTISSKMKEILQAPTPESRIVDEATDDAMEGPNWGLNLRICTMIGREEYDGAEIVRAIKRKLAPGKSPMGQRLGLDLLEACTSNCEKVYSEVASEKVVEDIVKLIDDSRTLHGVRVRAMQLIRAWGESEDLAYLPVFRQTYMQLKSRRAPAAQEETTPSMQYNLESYLDQQPLSPPERYPIPNTGFSQNAEDLTFIGYGFQSVEEKKEFLAMTRNTVDILSSILNSDTEPKPIKDDLTMSMLDKCKESLPVVQRIVESTSEDEVLLFDALNIHDELQRVISKHGEVEAALESGQPKSETENKKVVLPQQTSQITPEKSDCPKEGLTGSSNPGQEDSVDTNHS
ncbi:ENTH/VHS/GAT family protein [Striga hermonthica]|uniref:ENTH/VHS/GAT family protein n=1 Tax=Striga hermonthica TaxID=68872 RepID=A0A9N7N2T7_STRHE|nr:ENTH/VHS/GAT family protein [Striga hermonthica]